MDVAVQCAVELHHRRSALRIVEEVHLVASPGQMRDQLAVQRVLCRCYLAAARHLLLRPQAVVVVLELHGHAALAHLLELAALLPGVRPSPIIERVANGVVGDRLPVIRGQLVLPVAVRVRIGNGVYRRAGGEGVVRLGGDVPAAVVVESKTSSCIHLVCLYTQPALDKAQSTADWAGFV